MPKEQFKQEVEMVAGQNETMGNYLLQTIPEPDPGHSTRHRNRSCDVMLRPVPSLMSENDLCGFLGRRYLDIGNPETLSHSMARFLKFLPCELQQAFLGGLIERAS
jgi:hypothetical protein